MTPARRLGLLVVLTALGCHPGRSGAPAPEGAAEGEPAAVDENRVCDRQGNVAVHVQNQSSMDIRVTFGPYSPGRFALGFSWTIYRVPRYYVEGHDIQLAIARGGLQVGTPPPVATEPVACNDATLIIGPQPRYSFFYGSAPISGDEAGRGRPRRAAPPAPVTVDRQGIMRWAETGDEVALFGVNYTTPFAYAYRAHDYVGADRKAAINADVLHLSRLGVDAYRLHVWDREVTDRQGNLIENEHLDLLDYLLARLAEHGIRVILTPIAWWPPGYPEPDPPTEGLSDGYDKGEMTVNAEARRAQANYLGQFITHLNPYTNVTYADDPNLIAVEIFNEPRHPGGPAETTRYIDAMAEALRDAGFTKPIFYNISEGYSDEHGRAVCRAAIQGVSHQWYPTGLVRNGAVGGNMLPNVDRYPIPYGEFDECRNKARMVYEFDAADVAGSYLYPAMARSFREAGFQWATQFAYDPVAIAFANTEYQTHFLNLVYTPSKAISFLIAGAAFRGLPRGLAHGAYPEDERFGAFRVSYAEDLSEMVTDSAFYYSNNTGTLPPSPAALRHVAGVGTSAVVAYEGTGAFFLDRLDDGIWRLEVYPDAVWVVDPFTRPTLTREAARVYWRTRSLRLTLPDLGGDFAASPVNRGNDHHPVVRGSAMDVRPGVYLLTRSGLALPDWRLDTVIEGRRLDAFVAPPSSAAPTAVVHSPPAEVAAGAPFRVRVTVASHDPVDSVALIARSATGEDGLFRAVMEPAGAFDYEARLPGDRLREGTLRYAVTLYQRGEAFTHPGGERGVPPGADLSGRAHWSVPVVPAGAPVVLFDAGHDAGRVLYPHPWNYVPFRTAMVTGSEADRRALSAVVESLTPPPHHFAVRTFLSAGQQTRLTDAPADGVLRVVARAAAGRAADRMQVALVDRDGTAWGATIELTDEWRETEIPVAGLQRTALALLPRPYPLFLPYLFESAATGAAPRLEELDGLQLSVSADLFPGAGDGPHGFEIERVVLDRRD